MNIHLAIKPEYAAAILDGTKTVELRSYLPPNLHPGDIIFLCSSGRVWGHCTFAGATPMPPPGPCREQWLRAICVPAAVNLSVARAYLEKPGRTGYAWQVRYPVSYGATGLLLPGGTVQRYRYTSQEPHRHHPSQANFLLYLQTHKTP